MKTLFKILVVLIVATVYFCAVKSMLLQNRSWNIYDQVLAWVLFGVLASVIGTCLVLLIEGNIKFPPYGHHNPE